MADYSGCDARPHAEKVGCCDRCGLPLAGRRKRWCSQACADADLHEHYWSVARKAAARRDGWACITCGARSGNPSRRNPGKAVALEVNHIEPRAGQGYGTGCWNHLSNLETLCTDCHVDVTTAQAAAREFCKTLNDVVRLEEA